MHIRPFLFLIIPGVLLLFSCDKDEVRERDYPAIRTQAVNNITTEGARFNAIIISGDIESISEYGFVWDNSNNNLNLQYAEKIMVNGSPDQESFSCEVSFALEAMEEYYVRPYVKSGDYTVYGEIVKFRSLGSLAPEITDFEPKSATWGDTIIIYGRNFSNQAGTNRVLFGELEGRITNCTNDSLQVIIPGGLTQLSIYIAVEIYGNRSTASEAFTLIVPGRIINIDKTDITWGDTIELTGIFPFSTHAVGFKIENTNAVVLGNNESNIKIIVPNTIVYSDSVTVYLMIDGKKLAAPDRVHMVEPCINSITPMSFGWNDTITVFGVFHPAAGNNKILFSNTQASLIEVHKDRIRCVVPNTSSHECQLTAQIDIVNCQYPSVLSLNGPIINDITPSMAASGNYVQIKGKYFKDGATIIKINDLNSYAPFVNPQTLSVYIPEGLSNGPAEVEISVLNKSIITSDKLTIANPAIFDFFPKEGFYSDVVTISGEGFDPDDLLVTMSGGICEIIEASESQIKVKVPYEAGSNNWVVVITRGRELYSTSTFSIFEPEILSVSPLSVRPGDIVTISGNNFHPIPERNRVKMGNYLLDAISASTNQIQFKVTNLYRSSYMIYLYSGAFLSYSPNAVYCQSPWILRDDLIDGQSYASAVLYDGAVWAFGGPDFENEYQRFSFQGGDHQIFLGCPFYSNMGGIAFNVGDIGYFGLGKNYPDEYTKEFYRFDFTDRTWTKLNDFGGNGRISAFHFSVGNKCYMGGGLNFQDFWEYDVSSNSWTYLGEYPGGPSGRAIAFAVNEKAYVIDGKMVWEYNTVNGTWLRMNDFPGNEKYLATGFVINNRIYFGTGCDNYVIYDWIMPHSDFWRYDPSSDQWQRLLDIPYPRYASYSVTYDSKGYICGGKSGYEETIAILEYDPDYE